jgi:hypothetical protein
MCVNSRHCWILPFHRSVNTDALLIALSCSRYELRLGSPGLILDQFSRQLLVVLDSILLAFQPNQVGH